MPKYFYKAFRKDGEKVEGTIQAFSIQMARAKLTQQKLNVDTLVLQDDSEEETEPSPEEESFKSEQSKAIQEMQEITGKPSGERKQKVSAVNMSEITQRIADLSISHLPLTTGLLSIAENHPDSNFRKSVQSIVKDLEKGERLETVLEKHGFSEDFLAIIKAGLYSKNVESTIHEYIRQQNRSDRLINNFLKSFYYPLLLVFVTMIVILFMFYWIIPQFKNIFHDFGTSLPTLTKFVIYLSDLTIDYWFVLLLILALLMTGLLYLFNVLKKPGPVNIFMQNMPFFGRIFRVPSISRFCYSLSAFISQNVSMTDSFRMAGAASRDINYINESKSIAQKIENGAPAAVAITQEELFPPLFLQLMQWEDHPEFLSESLKSVSEMEEIRAQGRISLIAPIIEPFLLVILGGTVVTILISLFLPLIQLLNVLA